MSASSMHLELASTQKSSEHRTAATSHVRAQYRCARLSACSQPHRNLLFLPVYPFALKSFYGSHPRPRPHPPHPRHHPSLRRRPPLLFRPSAFPPRPPSRRHRPPRRTHHFLLPGHHIHRPQHRPYPDPLADLPLPPLASFVKAHDPLRTGPRGLRLNTISCPRRDTSLSF